jgi:predicted metal-dependent enzyme (double-stranded beta helix superfamily)
MPSTPVPPSRRSAGSIYTGREDNIFWRRPSNDPNGRIEAAGAKTLSERETVQLGPDIIHSVINPVNRLTGAIHVYGGDFFSNGIRNVFSKSHTTFKG